MKQIAALLYFSPVLAAVIGYQLHSYMAAAAAALGCILLMVIGIKARKLPIVQWRQIDGANGRNWPLYVMMDPDSEYPLAVLAQEIYESIYKTNPFNLLASRSGKGARELELRGHEIEVQAAARIYGVDESEYRQEEAELMAVGYKQFRGDSAGDIEAGMLRHSKMARRWVEDNLKSLRQ